MASISCNDLAEAILAGCLAGEPPKISAVRELVDRDCSEALFKIVVEGLADRFEPRLCDAYADLFSDVIARVLPGFRAPELRARYDRVRRVRRCQVDDPSRVFVLSRVTLGADIAITSVMLDAAKQRFPRAEIVFVGSEKAAELFQGDPRIVPRIVSYPRTGSLSERLGAWNKLEVAAADSIVIDPDSRLTQLGLLPVCADENYFFFESRALGAEGHSSLSELAAQWTQQTFGVAAAPYLSPATSVRPAVKQAAVSLGVGENPAKRISGDFEARLLRFLSDSFEHVVIDKGAGGEEAERVDRAIEGLPNVTAETGSFGSFTGHIAASGLYTGYDSAGQHAAGALGTPAVTVFAGFASERMLYRWRPSARGGSAIVKADPTDPDRTLADTIAAIKTL